jgi:putative ABC transport system substrate-binding protein
MNNRRKLVIAFGASTLSAPFAVRAQSSAKIARIGVLWHAASEEDEAPYFGALLRAFRDLGYVEGKNIVLEHRFPAEQAERFTSYAAELVGLKVDVLLAASTPSALAAQRATSSIPIVFAFGADPVALKLVESLAHPGGNITGLPALGIDLSAKRLEILKEAVPSVTRVAVLLNSTPKSTQPSLEAIRAAARTLKIAVLPVDIRRPEDLENALAIIVKERANGILTIGNPIFSSAKVRIAEFALARRLPTMLQSRETVEPGGFMSYAPNYRAIIRRAATYVDKILKGAQPRDLPVELPTTFELIINGNTAKALGITIPQSVLLRADEVIK